MLRRLSYPLFALALAAAVAAVLVRVEPEAPRFVGNKYWLPPPGIGQPLLHRGFVSPEGLTAAVHSGRFPAHQSKFARCSHLQ